MTPKMIPIPKNTSNSSHVRHSTVKPNVYSDLSSGLSVPIHSLLIHISENDEIHSAPASFSTGRSSQTNSSHHQHQVDALISRR